MFTSRRRSLKSLFGGLIVISTVVLGANGVTVLPTSAETTPLVPSNIVVTPGDKSVSISLSPDQANQWWELQYRWLKPGGVWATDGWNGNTGDEDYDYFGWHDGPYYKPALPYVVNNLTNGTEYRLKVRRGEGTGEPYAYSEESEWLSFTPYEAPATPTSLVATAGDGSVSIAFSAGSSDGIAITGYEYSTNGGASWVAASPAITSSPLAITGLTNGTQYSVMIRALSADGNGGASDAVTFTPAAAPAAPTSLVATAGDGSVSIAFSAGSSNGAAITGYEYSTNGGASWVAASPAITSSPLAMTGLTNGTQYSVMIRALNAIGNGNASTAVAFTPVSAVTTATVNTPPPPSNEVVLDLPTPIKPLIADTSLEAGAPVTLTFGGFVPGEFVQLIVASTPRVIASGYADSKGFITLSGDIPASLQSGNHSLALYAPVSGIGIRQPITVVAAVKTLPKTGSSRGSTVPLSVAVLSAGVLFMASARRRKSTELMPHL